MNKKDYIQNEIDITNKEIIIIGFTILLIIILFSILK
jgi:hypothetical protein